MPAINRDKLHFLAKKADVTLLTPSYWKDDLFTFDGTQDSEVKHYMAGTVLNGHEKAYFYFPKLTMLINEIKPDIIEIDQGANAVAYFQAIVMNKLFLGGRAKMGFFTWMNLPYANPFPFNSLEKYNLKNTDFAICGNRDAERILREKQYKGNITVMPLLGINPLSFSKNAKTREKIREKLGIKNEFCIGFFGRTVKEKGADDLITAVSKLKDKTVKLLIIGRGAEKEKLVKLANDLGIAKQTIFMDSVLHDEVPQYMNALDLFVLPSKTVPWWKEQFGHVVIEAMACEVPVIGSTCGEIPNVIGDAGLVFKEGNVDDLTAKITQVVQDKTLCKQLAKQGRQRILKSYTHEILANKMFEIYKNIL